MTRTCIRLRSNCPMMKLTRRSPLLADAAVARVSLKIATHAVSAEIGATATVVDVVGAVVGAMTVRAKAHAANRGVMTGVMIGATSRVARSRGVRNPVVMTRGAIIVGLSVATSRETTIVRKVGRDSMTMRSGVSLRQPARRVPPKTSCHQVMSL